MGVPLSWSLSKHLKIWWSLEFAFADDAVLLIYIYIYIYIYAASLFYSPKTLRTKKRVYELEG